MCIRDSIHVAALAVQVIPFDIHIEPTRQTGPVNDGHPEIELSLIHILVLVPVAVTRYCRLVQTNAPTLVSLMSVVAPHPARNWFGPSPSELFNQKLSR